MVGWSAGFFAVVWRWRMEVNGGQFDALYIQMINQQLNSRLMKKEEKWTPGTSKTRSIFTYELKATNQILKDTMEICQSSLHSTAHTNRHNYTALQQLDEYLFDDSYFGKRAQSCAKVNTLQKCRRQHPSNEILRSNSQKKSFQEFQTQKKSINKQLKIKNRFQRQNRQDIFERDLFHSSQIYSFSSQNENCPSKKTGKYYDKVRQTSLRKDINSQNKKQTKRDRRGLASISLKVKNIVAVRGKMTFKQVSDQVLEESQAELPAQTEAREKQMKNIRRRVYDALNVLVSVGILGKNDRCVVATSSTDIPGKKLSEHWAIITQKNRLLEQQKNSLKNRLMHLQKLKRQYQMFKMFQERNRNREMSESVEKREQNTRNEEREHVVAQQNRLRLPVIFLVPPKTQKNKIKVVIQYDENYSESIKKFTIDGLEGENSFLTDSDVLKYLNLRSGPKERSNLLSAVFFQSVSKGKEKEPTQNQNFVEKDAFLGQCEEEIYLSD